MKKEAQKQTKRQPFFTRFLEGQELTEAAGGGVPDRTTKFPSDSDEEWP